ncbi:MAG: hypothetical protein Q8M83_00730 [bacterium]|nr:hypothetical protein [bacterium]
MARVIYIEKNENIEEIIRHLKNTSEKQIILVVPQQASLFEGIDVLKDLKSHGDSLSKRITVISLDVRGLAMAEEAGLEVSRPKKIASGQLEHPMIEDRRQKRKKAIADFWTFKKRGRMPLKARILQVAGVAVVIALGVVIFFYAAVARTDIYLKTTPQPFFSNLQIVVDSRALEEKEEDGRLMIPGRFVSQNITLSEIFSSTGKKTFGDKASGEVTFYNFTEDTKIIRSEDIILRYKDFRFKMRAGILRVRPTAFIGLQSRKIDPTSLIAPQGVEAEDVGESYNLPGGAILEVVSPLLNLSSDLFYAQNSNPFLGGSKREVRVIDPSDIDKATRMLSDRISNNALGELSKSLKKGENLAQNKFEVKIIEQNVEPTTGSEVENFKITLSARVSGMAYDRDFLEKIVKNKIKAAVPAGSVIENENNMLNLTLKDVDIASGRVYITNNFQGILRPDFNSDDFKYTLRGKNEQELEEYFKKKPVVKSVGVKFSPKWFRRASWLSGRIFVRVE